MPPAQDPLCRKCRREGRKLFLKGERCLTPKCAIVKRNYPPGMHGEKRRSRRTNYGFQLREKQRAKRIYDIGERQFRLYYERAKKQRGKTGELMLQALERRLDNVVYRAGFAISRSQARQLVSHAHFLLNTRSVNIPSLQIHIGDTIIVKPAKMLDAYWAQLKKRTGHEEIPPWLTADKAKLTITVAQLPSPASITTDIAMHLIIEYYSR